MNNLIKSCVSACNKCIDDCSGKKGMEKCMSLCKVNRDVCKALLCAKKNNCDKAVKNCLVKACKLCCMMCVKECKKHEHSCCKNCVKVCTKLANSCKSNLSTKRKSSKRKSTKRKSTKRKSSKRKSTKRKSTKRKSSKRKSMKGGECSLKQPH